MPPQNILKTWQKTAKLWQKVKPTYKPSKIEIALFEKLLKKLDFKDKDFTVLVLGATPEIRNLLAKYRLNTTLLDANQIMVNAMNKLVKIKNPKEKIVIGNWLKMPLKDESFDLVISDHPTSSIKYGKLKVFFSQINRILKPQGHFIIDLHINAGLKPLTLDDYINLYKKRKKWFSNHDNKVLSQYQVIMGNNNFYTSKTFRSQWGKLDRLLRKRHEAGKLPRKEYLDLAPGLGEDYIFNFYPKKVLKYIIEKHFKILNYRQIKAHPVYQYYWPCFARALKSKKVYERF